MSTQQHQTPLPLTGAVKDSFAYVTVRDRWPKILTKVIDTVHRQRHTLVANYGTEGDEDVKKVIHELSEMRYMMMTDKPLTKFNDQLPDVQLYNDSLDKISQDSDVVASWYKSAWLYVECYLYRRIVGALWNTIHLRHFDPFAFQKETAFVSSLAFMNKMADNLLAMIQSHTSFSSDECRVTVVNLLQISLWGNQADLSISGGDRHEAPSGDPLDQVRDLYDNILVNDLDSVCRFLRVASGLERVDIILDNAGLELFSDLCLAEFLIDAKLARKVVFHGKAIAWFVSDTTSQDFIWTTEMLRSNQEKSLNVFGHKWNERIESGEFVFEAHSFWTSPYAYWAMSTYAPDLYAHLSQSSLLIFKGDLNYRKLVGDMNWPLETPFREALQDFHPTALVALRTAKADVAVGISQPTIARLKEKYGDSTDWMISGKYAFVQAFFPVPE